MGNMMQHIESELHYICSSEVQVAEAQLDEGQQAKHQERRGPMSWISVILLLGNIARAHSSLRGSVDFG